jgi:hypothetical protein
MSYTRKIIETAVSNFVPMGEELVKAGNKALGMNYTEAPKVSKRQQKVRIATAKSIHAAVKEGRLNPSFKKVAENMQTKAQTKLAEQSYTEKQYLFGQVSKAVPLLDLALPGSGSLATAAVRAGTAKNIAEFAKESSDLKSTAVKTATFATPIIIGATSTIWMPFVAPWLGLAAAGAAVAVGGAVVADAVNYMRGK